MLKPKLLCFMVLYSVTDLTFNFSADWLYGLVTESVVPQSRIIHQYANFSYHLVVWFTRCPVSVLRVAVWHRPLPAVHVVVQTDPGSLRKTGHLGSITRFNIKFLTCCEEKRLYQDVKFMFSTFLNGNSDEYVNALHL